MQRLQNKKRIHEDKKMNRFSAWMDKKGLVLRSFKDYVLLFFILAWFKEKLAFVAIMMMGVAIPRPIDEAAKLKLDEAIANISLTLADAYTKVFTKLLDVGMRIGEVTSPYNNIVSWAFFVIIAAVLLLIVVFVINSLYLDIVKKQDEK